MLRFKHFPFYHHKEDHHHTRIYLLGLLLFFWALFDGILAYLSPLVITEHGFSKTYMGFIIGSSSIFGALFDVVAIKVLPSMHFRRVFMIMFLLCFIYPFLLFGAKTSAMYLLAMVAWGIYYDLKNFGLFNFVAENTSEEEHATSFGLLQGLQSLGYFIAPIFAGVVAVQLISWVPFSYALLFLTLSFICFLILVYSKKFKQLTPNMHKHKRVVDIRLWLSLDKIIFPVLLTTFVLYVIDAFFWTIGPLFAESLSIAGYRGELVLAAYTFPGLLVGGLVQRSTKRLGKKRTAYISLLIGSLLLLFITTVNNYYVIISLIFISGIFLSMAFPATNGVYADLIQEKTQYGDEIETLTDFYTNLSYVVGPIAAGILADSYGSEATLSMVGILGVVVSLFLIKITPRHINIPRKI